jgi:FkbM family methyltransferase
MRECYNQLIELYPSVSVYDLALSDTSGKNRSNMTSNPGYSGFKRRRYDRPEETVVEVRVKTDLLDNIIPQSLQIDFIKIDVEDAEFQVLNGAVRTIQDASPLLFLNMGWERRTIMGRNPRIFMTC